MGYKPFDLTGKVALITGGNGGIGLGMAEALAQSGAGIVIWGSNATKNAKAVEALKPTGVEVIAQTVNVADESEVASAMVEAVSKMGRVDTVIANAGVGGGGGAFETFSTDGYRRTLGVNLDGVFFTFREACKHIVERSKSGDKGGSLVVTSSLSAISGAARNEAYAATKGAVITLMKALAVEYARYDVRANAILPGWIATDMTAGAQGNDKFTDKVIARVPMRRWGEPSDFGGMAVYLASDASRFHTGDSFIIDGGYHVF